MATPIEKREAIVRDYQTRRFTQSELAKLHGVGERTVGSILQTAGFRRGVLDTQKKSPGSQQRGGAVSTHRDRNEDTQL